MAHDETLQEEIGQLFMVGFDGLRPTAAITDLIKRERVGGIILFARNIHDAQQVRELTAELQSTARAAGHAAPLLIATDQEHGVVRRLGAGATPFPGNMAQGAIGSEQSASDIAFATGQELLALGINMNLAPVVDVNNNPANPVIGVRSFGEDPRFVARLGAAAVRGYRASGVISCLKHFPGHGDTTQDSHLTLPSISHSLERLEAVELIPFAQGIAAGADAVMVAHVVFPALTGSATLPATVAPAIVQGLLRERLGFTGVIVTDCLEMSAISEGIGTEEAAWLALRAGVDIAAISHRADRQRGAIERVRTAVARGALARETLGAAAERVRRLKVRSHLSWEDSRVVSMPDGEHHRALSERAYAEAVTLVRGDTELPILRQTSGERLLVLYPRQDTLTLAENGDDDAVSDRVDAMVAEAVRRYYPHAELVSFPLRPTPEQIARIVARARQAGVVLAITLSAHLFPPQEDLIKQTLAGEPPVVGIAARSPYDVALFPRLRAALAIYEYSLPALTAAMQVIRGEISARGRLPVSVNVARGGEEPPVQ